MTLRELIHHVMDRGYFNKTVAFLHTVNDTFKDRKMEEVYSAYTNAIRELIELPGSEELEGWTIIVDSEEQDGEEYSDVYLADDQEGKAAMDFIDWIDIIDLPINDRISRELSEKLGHVLYEITWWGFTRSSVNQQREELEIKGEDAVVEFSSISAIWMEDQEEDE